MPKQHAAREKQCRQRQSTRARQQASCPRHPQQPPPGGAKRRPITKLDDAPPSKVATPRTGLPQAKVPAEGMSRPVAACSVMQDLDANIRRGSISSTEVVSVLGKILVRGDRSGSAPPHSRRTGWKNRQSADAEAAQAQAIVSKWSRYGAEGSAQATLPTLRGLNKPPASLEAQRVLSGNTDASVALPWINSIATSVREEMICAKGRRDARQGELRAKARAIATTGVLLKAGLAQRRRDTAAAAALVAEKEEREERRRVRLQRESDKRIADAARRRLRGIYS